jgi:hypothetical protein
VPNGLRDSWPPGSSLRPVNRSTRRHPRGSGPTRPVQESCIVPDVRVESGIHGRWAYVGAGEKPVNSGVSGR